MGLLINTFRGSPIVGTKETISKGTGWILGSILKAIRTKEGFEGVECHGDKLNFWKFPGLGY